MVEQGTENPRVGGSIPSLATSSLRKWLPWTAWPLLLAGCATDPCNSLCTDVALALDGCLGEWGASWEDLGAESRVEYRLTCQEQWDAARAALEVRQVPEEEDRCTAGAAALNDLSCGQLRVLYLEP